MNTTATSLEKLDQAATRVLDMLQRWDDRFKSHTTQRRRHARRPFRTKITVVVTESRDQVGEIQDKSVTEVWTRNISAGGLAFISYGPIPSKSDKVVVSLGERFLLSQIIRSRPVHDGFWEYGVSYIEEARM